MYSVLIVSGSCINIIVYLGTRFGSKCLKSRNGNYKNYEENIKEVEAENSLLVYWLRIYCWKMGQLNEELVILTVMWIAGLL